MRLSGNEDSPSFKEADHDAILSRLQRPPSAFACAALERFSLLNTNTPAARAHTHTDTVPRARAFAHAPLMMTPHALGEDLDNRMAVDVDVAVY